MHDCGGPIGLRLAVEHPDRVDRLVVMDSGLLTGRQQMTDAEEVGAIIADWLDGSYRCS